MKNLAFTLIFLFIISASSFSQRKTFKIEDSGITPAYRGSNDGNVVITQDARLLELVNQHKSKNKDRFIGWRVQIYFNSGQRAMLGAQNAKKKFLTRYGNKYGAYTVYDSPFYKIRVGDFRTKAEAMHFKDKIKKTFPNSWIIGDILVNYPVD